MWVDLTKLVFLLIGYALHGAPDDWDRAWAVRASLQWGERVTGALEVSYDPVAIYRRPMLTQTMTSLAVVQFYVLDPSVWDNPVAHQHELNHIWQHRTFGLIVPLTYGADPRSSIWEPKPYKSGVLEHMPAPRQLNFSLFRFVLPLDLGR